MTLRQFAWVWCVVVAIAVVVLAVVITIWGTPSLVKQHSIPYYKPDALEGNQ